VCVVMGSAIGSKLVSTFWTVGKISFHHS
jgi:hypothetical protein